MAQALVLGATGHIGAHIVRALLAAGHQVRAAYRRDTYLHVLDGLPVERMQVDLDDAVALQDALAGCAWVFHAAGYVPAANQQRAQAISSAKTSVRHTLDVIHRAQPARVVFTSSAVTLRHISGRAATADDPAPWPTLRSTSLYATVKIAMEQEVLRAAHAGLPVVMVNPAKCIGEYDARPSSGQMLLTYAKQRGPYYMDFRFNVVYTGDVGIGHVRAAERGRVGGRYLLAGHVVTRLDVMRAIAQTQHVAIPRWRVPYSLAMTIAAGAELVGTITRTAPRISYATVRLIKAWHRLDGLASLRELALPDTAPEEAIQRAMRWFQQQGYIH